MWGVGCEVWVVRRGVWGVGLVVFIDLGGVGLFNRWCICVCVLTG